MPKSPVKGTRQLLVELPEELVDEAKAFAAARGETVKEVVATALRRHMSYPPPPPVPPPGPAPPVPLPDAAPAAAPTKKGPAKKGPAKKGAKAPAWWRAKKT